MQTLTCLKTLLIVGVAAVPACTSQDGLLLPASESAAHELVGLSLVARIAHITDTHVVDEESPARFAGAHAFTHSAWRPYESYSTQLLDGFIRTVNRIHAAGRPVDFLLHTGDACDNAQSNELAWFIGVMDGELIDPLSGPDDRAADGRPPPSLDPHASFLAQGLYQTGRHGTLPSIPWYALLGNHEAYAIGVFPIVESTEGRRTAPLPLQGRPGLALPVRLDPLASFAYGNVTPGEPGPPCLLETPGFVEPNPARAYFSKREFVQAMFETVTGPTGHGFDEPRSDLSCYSVSPIANLRLIGLDTTDRGAAVPGGFYHEGAISHTQLTLLRDELDAALAADELVIVASHHPSASLRPLSGSEVAAPEFRALLNEYPNVVLHLAGHKHRNRVTDRGGYLEIETCSTLDLPQEGRLIEIWRDQADGTVMVSYEMFSHLDDTLPPLGDDPLRAMRAAAQAIAQGDKGAAGRQKRFDPSGQDPRGEPNDRRGVLVLTD